MEISAELDKLNSRNEALLLEWEELSEKIEVLESQQS